jgi:ABC-2 type transport system permease protein
MKELREIFSGRALWIMVLLVCPLTGYGFFQAVSLYGEASIAGQQSPALASSLSPFDGVIVPTFGSLYVAVTLLFPFVAIRVLSHEKETGGLRLLLQLPYNSSRLIAAKAAAVFFALLFVSIPAASAIGVWRLLGGHVFPPEILNLVFGHLLYGALVGAVALFAASISESAATAAIITLAFTIGSWVLDFTVAGRPGLLDWVARLSLTQTLRVFEQGLLSIGVILGMLITASCFAALSGVWLNPGVRTRSKLARSVACVLATAITLGIASQLRLSIDVTEDQRNSFPPADRRLLGTLTAPLAITVHLAPEDPRYADLQRNVLAKLERAMPNVTIRFAGGRRESSQAGDEHYGEVEYTYSGRSDTSRSTSHREILPLLYGLADVQPPAPIQGGDFPGYPLIADEYAALPWFFGALPLLTILAWWWSRRPPNINLALEGGSS